MCCIRGRVGYVYVPRWEPLRQGVTLVKSGRRRSRGRPLRCLALAQLWRHEVENRTDGINIWQYLGILPCMGYCYIVIFILAVSWDNPYPLKNEI